MGAEKRMQSARLILASASPRRRELLTQAGYTFEVNAADVDESLREGEEAGAYVLRLAEEKARAVFARYPTHRDETAMDGAPSLGADDSLIVLGADTSVVLGNEILGKPVD